MEQGFKGGIQSLHRVGTFYGGGEAKAVRRMTASETRAVLSRIGMYFSF
jgi:hypothetical protein